jgi:hypothetical protein
MCYSAGMSSILLNHDVQNWLNQFPDKWRASAERLVSAMLLVGSDELKRGLRALLAQLMDDDTQRSPVALYAEREIELDDDKNILPIFGKSDQKRATGLGPDPLLFDHANPEIGSEAPLANFITNLARDNPDRYCCYPGPDIIREKRIRRVVIVTDFIGSGSRVNEMLEAFRLVRSVRSWKSSKHIDFCVVAYSATQKGLNSVLKNRLKPKVLTSIGCPTINEAFKKDERASLFELCRNFPEKYYYPLGLGHTGALIAFEHGIPDNTPALFHEAEGWQPLFRGRSTVRIADDFPSSNFEAVRNSAKELLKIGNAERYLKDNLGGRWIKTLLVLKAIRLGAHDPHTISSKSRLKIEQVEDILDTTRISNWTNSTNQLTKQGRRELDRLKRRRHSEPILPSNEKMFYFPTQLRAR